METKNQIQPIQRKVTFRPEDIKEYEQLKSKGYFTEKFSDYVRSSFYEKLNKDKLRFREVKNGKFL